MANVKKMDDYDFDSPFPTKFRALLKGDLSTPAKRQVTPQRDIAKILGCSRQTIGRYADGKGCPDIIDLQKIAKYYEVSCDWLLGNDTYITKEIEEISVAYGLKEDTLLKLKDIAFNPFTESGKYMMGSVTIIELLNNLVSEDIENGVLNAIAGYLSADTLYTIDSYDLQNVTDTDQAYKLKEKVKEVDKILLDTSLFFNIQVKLKQLKEKLHPITKYK